MQAFSACFMKFCLALNSYILFCYALSISGIFRDVNEVDYFNGRVYDHRLVTNYLSPSNHLLMQWQTTPAVTAIIKESIKNILLN